jgi:hypothetical protein
MEKQPLDGGALKDRVSRIRQKRAIKRARNSELEIDLA